jgi:hypothetical protein
LSLKEATTTVKELKRISALERSFARQPKRSKGQSKRSITLIKRFYYLFAVFLRATMLFLCQTKEHRQNSLRKLVMRSGSELLI